MHSRIQPCHSAFVTEQLHFHKYCVSSPIYDHKGAFVLGGCCVFMRGSTGLLFVEAVLDYHCRKRQLGMCLGSVGSGLACCQAYRWPESQSLFFSFSGCLVPLTHKLPLFLSPPPYPHPPFPSQIKTFPLVNRGRKSRVEDMTDSQKNISLCGHGMLIIGCKYAAEEALNTATTLNKWAHLSSTMPVLFLLQCLLAAC